MTIKTKAVLKTYYEQGDIPTEGQYKNLIDSSFNLGETDTQIIQGTLSASAAEIESMTFKKLYLPGNGIDSMKVGTTFRIGKSLEVSGSLNVTQGNITITSSGEFQGENATITNISGSFISASGHIYSAGNISASGHISGSATSTGSFGRVEVASRIERAGDENTGIRFFNNGFSLFADNVQGAKFATTGGTSIGNTTYSSSISGSQISLSGNLNGSTATFSSFTIFNKAISASEGIVVTANSEEFSAAWDNASSTSTLKRSFNLSLSSLPRMDEGKIFSTESMTISNAVITANSIVLVNHSSYENDAGRFISLHVSSVSDGSCVITPMLINGTEESIAEGGSANYNFTIL